MRQPEFITSPANPLLKDIRKAVSRGGLTDHGWCVAETFHLLEEVLRGGCQLQAVVAAESARAEVEPLVRGLHDLRLAVVPDTLLDAASQGVVALVEPPAWDVQQLFGPQPLLLILDGVQDPGNLGTILRSAEAFGATGVLLLKGTVNPYNSKAVRASAGSVFRVPFVSAIDECAALEVIRDRRVDLYAAMPGSAQAPAQADLRRSTAIVIGSEGRGVSAVMQQAASPLSIPTSGVESLNAAISAAVLLYEARRQRSQS